VPMYIYMYLFNVTNAEDVLNFKAKPILEQIGPYTYTYTHTVMHSAAQYPNQDDSDQLFSGRCMNVST